MRSYKRTVFVIVTVFAIVFQLTNPIRVYADDGTPPPPDETATEVAPEESVETGEPVAETETSAEIVEEPAATAEEPVDEESVAAEEQPAAKESDQPVEEESAPVDDPAVEELSQPAEEESAEAADITIAEVIEDLPEGTGLLVVDETGESLPLASEDAAQALSAADPYFKDGTGIHGYSSTGICPAFVTTCTASTNPIQAAVDAFKLSSTASGNIYVEAGTYAENVNIISVAKLEGLIGAGSSVTTLNGNLLIKDMGAFTVSGFTINGNNTSFSGGALTVRDSTGTLELTDLNVTNPNGYGIYVDNHTGDVNLNKVKSNHNKRDGVNVDSDGNVSLTNVAVGYNGGDGFDIYANGNLSLTNVVAIGNDYSGLYADADNVTLAGTNIFNKNGYSGLDVWTYGNFVSIPDSRIIANGNGYGAVEGPGDGAYIDAGRILIGGTGNQFNSNYGSGLNAFVEQANSFTANCSSFSNNGGYGINNVAGTPLTLNSVNFAGNTSGDYTGTATINSIGCGRDDPPAVIPPLVTTIIFPPGESEIEFELECANQLLYAINLPNGDEVQIVCPVSGTARISRVDSTTLPGEPPAGFIYAAAFTVEIFQDGVSIPFISEGGHINALFLSPPLNIGVNYAILYWDNSAWVPLKEFMLDENGNPRVFDLDENRHVISGLRFVVADGVPRVEVSADFLGIFMLVQR